MWPPIDQNHLMRGIWNQLFGGKCEHINNLVVTSVGVTRTVCEQCGRISFEMDRTGVLYRASPTIEPEPQLPRASSL
jgi:hypothetical protein